MKFIVDLSEDEPFFKDLVDMLFSLFCKLQKRMVFSILQLSMLFSQFFNSTLLSAFANMF
jgi:hypothetical protein